MKNIFLNSNNLTIGYGNEIVIKKGLKPDFSISEAIKIIDENSLKILNSNISSKPIR